MVRMEDNRRKKQKRLYLGLITMAAVSVVLCISLVIAAGELIYCSIGW